MFRFAQHDFYRIERNTTKAEAQFERKERCYFFSSAPARAHSGR